MVKCQCHVRSSFEGGYAACDEKQSRIARFEEQRYEDSGHNLSTSCIDVPGLIPHLSHRHFP